MTNVLRGQDSVSPGGMQHGQDVYAGYGGFSHFSNMGGIHARFPGKRYVVVDTHVSQVDVYDIEPGGGSASEAPAFFHQWRPVNTNKPVFYASRSQIGSVVAALSSAGIARSRYYLWVAQWDGSSAIPGGYDAKQYGSNASFDSDVFYDYMFGPVKPVNPWPLRQGANGPEVLAVQKVLNQLAVRMKIAKIAEDGSFGPQTLAAVRKAQAVFGAAPGTADEVTQDFYVGLQHRVADGKGGVPVPPVTPPPVVHPNCAPVANLKLMASGPHSFRLGFDYPSVVNGMTPAFFEIVVCHGSHLGPVIPTFPRNVKYVTTGHYDVQYGGVDTTVSQYIIAVRAIGSDGHHASAWETVLLPKK